MARVGELVFAAFAFVAGIATDFYIRITKVIL
jgi:hypothetical protein